MNTNASHQQAGTGAAFVHEDTIAEPAWLAEHLDNPTVKIVDTRFTVEQDEQGRFVEIPGTAGFLEAHIPGAVFLNLNDLRDHEHPEFIVSPEVFAEIMSGLGIGNDDEVVVYDTDGGVWAARLWWALRLYGHERVRLLNGSFGHWVAEGLPTESGDRIVAPGVYAVPRTGDLAVTLDEVVAVIDDPAVAIIDGLSEPFHTGRMRLYASLPAGHIPGAVNMPAPDNLEAETGRLLPPDALAERWAEAVGEAERIITYCGGGMYGAFDLYVLHLLGYDAVLYDGAWEEWAARGDLPIATSLPG